jgi:RNA polymerase sigma-70 factor (ECF subfamily)
MHNKDILKLIGQCLDNNKESFAPVVRHFQEKIYRLCFQYLGTLQDAEDAAAEVFIKAFRSLSSYDFKYAFSTWLYRIAVNHSVSLLRRRKLERDYLTSEESGPLTTGNPPEAPETVFFEDTRRTEFHRALETLPVNNRTALVLKYQQDLSYKEIAGIMELPVNTVGSLILRGKKELREKVSLNSRLQEVVS